MYAMRVMLDYLAGASPTQPVHRRRAWTSASSVAIIEGFKITELEFKHVTFFLAGCILQNLVSNKQRGGKRNKTKRGGTLRKKRNIRKFRKTNRS